MQTMKEAAAEFLANRRVAVTGVSRTPKSHGSNVVYDRLRQRGYEVFAVNPNAEEVEGDPCYHDLASIPGGVDAVVIGTRPEFAEATMRECVELGIKHVWMHRGLRRRKRVGSGDGVRPRTWHHRDRRGCPLMFPQTADAGHRGDATRVFPGGQGPEASLRPGRGGARCPPCGQIPELFTPADRF